MPSVVINNPVKIVALLREEVRRIWPDLYSPEDGIKNAGDQNEAEKQRILRGLAGGKKGAR
jgi:hypothetical protein